MRAPPDKRTKPAPVGTGPNYPDANRDACDLTTGVSPLRRTLDDAIDESGGSLKDLTVLATQNDPFRVDTPARHRDGEWLATTARDLGLGDRKIHLRGLHYMLIGRPKPDGLPLVDSRWSYIDQTKALIASKAYEVTL